MFIIFFLRLVYLLLHIFHPFLFLPLSVSVLLSLFLSLSLSLLSSSNSSSHFECNFRSQLIIREEKEKKYVPILNKMSFLIPALPSSQTSSLSKLSLSLSSLSLLLDYPLNRTKIRMSESDLHIFVSSFCHPSRFPTHYFFAFHISSYFPHSSILFSHFFLLREREREK